MSRSGVPVSSSMYTLLKIESYKPVIGITLDMKHNKSIEGLEKQRKRMTNSTCDLLWSSATRELAIPHLIHPPTSVCHCAGAIPTHSLKSPSCLLSMVCQLIRGSAKDNMQDVGDGKWTWGSMTSILHTGHCSAVVGWHCETSENTVTHTTFCCINHSSTSCKWKMCPQGSKCTQSPTSNWLRQIVHSNWEANHSGQLLSSHGGCWSWLRYRGVFFGGSGSLTLLAQSSASWGND